jgi:hypothetical protein
MIQNAVHLSKTVDIFNTFYTVDEALNANGSNEIDADVKTEKYSSVA